MFGTNGTEGQRYFKDATTDGIPRLQVTSIFKTLQGEGPFAGRPAIFVRLTKCNLRCSFCDTYFDTGDWFTYAELEQRIEEVAKGSLSNLVLVITGGEPSLQKVHLVPFLERMKNRFSAVQIESNGLLSFGPMSEDIVLVVSPKCFESAMGPTHYLRPPIEVLSAANCLKFVVTADEKSPYHTVPKWAKAWGGPVYVSPMNIYHATNSLTSRSALADTLANRSKNERVSFWEPNLLDLAKVRDNHEYAAQYCLENGFTLSLQMQLFCSLA